MGVVSVEEVVVAMWCTLCIIMPCGAHCGGDFLKPWSMLFNPLY